MLNVNSSVQDWLPDVHEQEHWHEWEDKSHPVLGETNVDHTVSLEGSEWRPISVVCWLSSKGPSLLSQALDVLVDSALHLWFDLESLNHLNDLLLLLIDRAVLSADFSKTLIDIVLETL